MWWRTITAQQGRPKQAQQGRPKQAQFGGGIAAQPSPAEDLKSDVPAGKNVNEKNVNGPDDETPSSKNGNDPYAVGKTRAQQEMDDLNHDPAQPAWYNMPLGAQLEKLHMNQSVHPDSPLEATNTQEAPTEMNATAPQLIRNFQEYNTGKGEQAFKDNPATLHTI